MTIETGLIGVGLALMGIVFGWGASWATLGQKIESLRGVTERLLNKMDQLGELPVRVESLDHRVTRLERRADSRSKLERFEEAKEG